MTVRFDAALTLATSVVHAHLPLLGGAGRVRLVRDLFGRCRLAVELRVESLRTVDAELEAGLGAYFAGPALVGEEMLAADLVFGVAATELRRCDGVEVVERVVIGAEWTRGALPNQEPRPPRATLYGLKGGVGRSSALAAWSMHLARMGERVLVVDLDLESPGVSSSLLPAASTEYGVVDWLVEDAVGQADDELLRLMVSRSTLSGGRGAIIVAPCGGSTGVSYLDKLARAYVQVPSAERTKTFAERIAHLVDELEGAVEPSVVLLDSRAGLHDIAGITTTRLGALTLLFAVDTPQTWAGYRTLLSAWGSRPAIAREVRERLQIVAAQVPETGRNDYLQSLRLHAYDAFEPLYDQPPARAEDEPTGTFNPDIDDPTAPHSPLAIYWSRELQSWDPLRADVTDDQLRASFGPFLDRATELLLAERASE